MVNSPLKDVCYWEDKEDESYKRTRPLCCFLLFAVRKEGRLQSQNFLEQEGMEQLVSLQGLQAVK